MMPRPLLNFQLRQLLAFFDNNLGSIGLKDLQDFVSFTVLGFMFQGFKGLWFRGMGHYRFANKPSGSLELNCLNPDNDIQEHYVETQIPCLPQARQESDLTPNHKAPRRSRNPC